MSYTDITFGDVPLVGDSGDLGVLPIEAYVSSVIRGFLGAIRDDVQDVPGRPGSVSFDERPGDRTITIDITLLAESAAERRTAIETLADWAELSAPAPLIISDEPDRYWDAKLSGMSDPDESVITAVVELVFRAGPYAKALELTELTPALTLVDGVAQTFDIADTVNADPVLELTAAGGGIPAGFVLTVNGVDFLYGSPMTAGDIITISTVGFTVSAGANTDLELDGTFDEDALAMSAVDGDFPTLIPGTNTIKLVGGGAGVDITWRRRFRA